MELLASSPTTGELATILLLHRSQAGSRQCDQAKTSHEIRHLIWCSFTTQPCILCKFCLMGHLSDCICCYVPKITFTNQQSRQFDPDKQFTRADFSFFAGDAFIRVWWSKNIQFRERVVQITLPYVLGSILPCCCNYSSFSFTTTVPLPPKFFIMGISP